MLESRAPLSSFLEKVLYKYLNELMLNSSPRGTRNKRELLSERKRAELEEQSTLSTKRHSKHKSTLSTREQKEAESKGGHSDHKRAQSA